MLDRVQPHGGATTVEARREHDINAKALKHWPVLYNMIVDWHGRPLAEVRRLGNPDLKIDPERRNQERGARLREFRGGQGYTGWRNGDGASGADLIDLVAYLGECDRKVASEWLGRLVNRLSVVELG